MLKIKNYYFLITFIFVNIFSSILKQIFQVAISDILLITIYFVYTMVVIYKLNKIFQCLNKYFEILFYFSYMYIFYGVFYGLYLEISLGDIEYIKYIDNFNNTTTGSVMNTILYTNIFFVIPFLLTKTLLSSEKKINVKVFDYSKDFLKFFFPPIGIWLMVPRINKVYEDTIAENDENR